MLRIHRVVIQGFKTFAQRTEFVFDPGVTAIVGPNGSGKSNVADAVRWCLGEQSFSLLRSKKTADVIFAGSDKRARMGMATVSLTLDNRDGELPIDFAEVEITRRAYRDGDNEYLLNGRRVRLQDISELLAPSGLGKRTYAVIGQGLIDQVLSLRPEERRALFEEAAGITGYQAKRASALRRLEATQHNLERVRDILAELAPRLKHLKRQAERAGERDEVEAELEELLRTWYGYRWHSTLGELAQCRQALARAQGVVEARRQRLDAISARVDQIRRQQGGLREELHQQRARRGELQSRAQSVGRQLAVAVERLGHLQARRDELERELAALSTRREARAEQMQSLEAELVAARADFTRSQADFEQLRTELTQREQERRQLAERSAALAEEQRVLSERMAEGRSRLQGLVERLQALGLERERQEQALAELESEQLAAVQAREAAETDLAATAGARRARQEEVQALESALAEARRAQESAEEEQRSREREVDRLQTRLEMLERLRREGAGYASGVRAILRAGAQQQLTGILGTVASRIGVPSHLEKAIETALGGGYQNIITRSWEEARKAIDHLKSSREGRATFLPLDRLYPGQAIPAPELPGILGNGAEMVDYAAEVADAVAHQLNRVWIAEDLAAARQALDGHRGSRPTVVTLDGEIIRPGGAVSGGSDGRRSDGSVLAREQELRALPGHLAEARARADAGAAELAALGGEIEDRQQELAILREAGNAEEQEQEERRRSLEGARRHLERIEQRSAWQADLARQTRDEMEEIEARIEQGKEEMERRLARKAILDQEARDAAAAVGAAGIDALLQEASDLRAAAARSESRLRSREEMVENQRRALDESDRQHQAKEEQLAAAVTEAQTLAADVETMGDEESRLQAEVAGLESRIAPAEGELNHLESEQEQQEDEERQEQKELRREEETLVKAQLALQHREDQLAALRREIGRDFGLVEMETEEEIAYQPPLPLAALVAQLPVVVELPRGLEQTLRNSRARLRRLDNVNPEAPAEYREAAARHDFLVEQSTDLERADADLRRVIRELDRRMVAELQRTITAAAGEFSSLFRLLFQGGSAQLTLTDPDDVIHSGIEISVRPPGKRSQSLDLLSGGERSLTACALVFAILRVSPTPFCVLDEVDAALDEANVDRFRTVLEGLSERTQFILITHNRRTLEAADGIYGITMGDDGVSRVISLRLEGGGMVEENGDGETAPAAQEVGM